MANNKMATAKDINDKSYREAFYGLNYYYKNVYKCPTYAEITSIPILSVKDTSGNDLILDSDQLVDLDRISCATSVVIPVTITESVSGQSQLEKVQIGSMSFADNSTALLGVWSCGSVDGSKTANVTCNLSGIDLTGNNLYTLRVYIGKTGANRTFKFTATFDTFSITKTISSVKETTWDGTGTVVPTDGSNAGTGYVTINYGHYTYMSTIDKGKYAGSLLGGYNIEKLKKITIAIS